MYDFLNDCLKDKYVVTPSNHDVIKYSTREKHLKVYKHGFLIHIKRTWCNYVICLLLLLGI